MILPDLLAPDLQIVFCGTAVGETSAQKQAYYARPGNRFWPALHESGLTPYRFQPHEYPELLEYRLGLTDLAKEVFGNDSVLSKTHFDCERLENLLHTYRPKILAFTSKRGAQEFLGHLVSYGIQPETVGATQLFVLTSPSGQASRYWSLEPWKELANLVRA